MNNEVYSVTCPYCHRRQIVEINSQGDTKGAPIFFPISPDTAIGGLGDPFSQNAATHAVSGAKETHQHVQNLNNFSLSSVFSAFNIFAFIKIISRWVKGNEKSGWKNQNKQDLWLTVNCSKCRRVYLYNHQTKDYVRIRPDT